MSNLTRRNFLKTSGMATATALLGSSSVHAGGDGSGRVIEHDQPITETHPALVGTWTASPQAPSEEANSEEGFNNQTLRMIAHPSVGGERLRIRLANTFGSNPVTFEHVEVGRWDEAAAVVPDSNQEVTFGGESSITIPPGAKAYSDPVAVEVDAEQPLAVSIYLPHETGPATFHRTGKKLVTDDPEWTTYVSETGDYAAETSADAFTTKVEPETVFYLEAIDIVAPDIVGTVVTVGDSITDGSESSVDATHTYPDFLARRLNQTSTVRKSVLNAGIGGNRILNNSIAGGESALTRLDRDVLAQTGVTDVILLEGINDIGFSNFPEDDEYDPYEPFIEVTAEDVIQGLKQIIARVHAKELNIIGGTLTPFKGATYYYEEGEEKRQTVNHWIRTSGTFDSVVDFDKVIRDPADPKRLLSEYDSGDHIHPSDAGYQAMAEAIDLELLRGPKQQDRGQKRRHRKYLSASTP